MHSDIVTEHDDPDGVFWWRSSQLIEAGYGLEAALTLAALDVDLHKAVQLMKQGCSEAAALQILI